MKCFLRPFVLGLHLMGLLSGPAWAQTKIGTINLPKVFDNYWKRKDAETALKDRETDNKKELQSMMSDFNKARRNIKNCSPAPTTRPSPRTNGTSARNPPKT